MAFCNISDAGLIPNINCLYLGRPTCVVNVVIYLDSSCRTNGWYPLFRSIFEDSCAPFNSVIISSIVGVINLTGAYHKFRFTF